MAGSRLTKSSFQREHKQSDSSEPSGDLEILAKEVLLTLSNDNLPPTPSKYALYFDIVLEKKSEALRKEINEILSYELDNEDEKSIELEKTLKDGFSSVKGILSITASLYKNMSLMSKILKKRKDEFADDLSGGDVEKTTQALSGDVTKLSGILQKQIASMKEIYETTADVLKQVENETIYDSQFNIYNKRYFLTKIEKELNAIKEFKHDSTFIMIELSREIEEVHENEKVRNLMNRTISRLLLKTSRRSDIVAHYGGGIFVMILMHTNLDSAKKASERLIDMVSSSNFFLGEKEIQLKISIGVSIISPDVSVEENIVCALDAMSEAYEDDSKDYAICTRSKV